MKKIIALILTLILIMSLGTVAFATEATGGVGDYSTDVFGSYVPGSTTSGTLFSVQINWEDMSFTYYGAVAGAWNDENHQYDPTTPARWVGKGTITVTNNSNAKITATPKYTAAAGYEDATMTFAPGKLSIASAESSNQAETGTITVTPGGSLPEMDGSKTIGSITVTIAEDTNVTAEEMQALIDQANALYDQFKNNVELKNQMGDTYIYFDMYKRTASDVLEAYVDKPEDNQETLNNAYANLLTYYHKVLELMPE